MAAFVPLNVFMGHQIIHNKDSNLECLRYFGAKKKSDYQRTCRRTDGRKDEQTDRQPDR